VMSIFDQIKAIKDYETRYTKTQPLLELLGQNNNRVGVSYDSDGRFQGYHAYSGDSAQPVAVPDKYITREPSGNGLESAVFNRAAYVADNLGPKPEGDKAALLKQALSDGVDLRPFYGETYADAVRFKEDLGQYAGKDQSMIIPANPLGYSGQFKFDPNFGSSYYRDLAMQSGRALGLDENQILKQGTEYFADKFASGGQNKGAVGFTDFGAGLIDKFATSVGVPQDKLGELRETALKPLYDANQQVFQGLSKAAAVESQSSGVLKGLGQDFAKLGPIGTIALAAALGPAAGALSGSLGGGAALTAGLAAGGASAIPGLLQGDISGGLKAGLTNGLLAGIGAGAFNGVAPAVSDYVGGGTLGNIAGGAAQNSLKAGAGALLTGGDLGQGLLSGGLLGGISGGLNSLFNSNSGGNLGTGLIPPPNANDILGQGGGSSLQLGGGITPPANFDFGPVFELPNTTGYVNTTPEIGGLFDEIKFPSIGLNPGVLNNQDFGSGIGQGLKVPESPNVGGGLGQGLTVGVPGGILGETGITPIGAVNLGDPSSFINTGAQSTSGAVNAQNSPNLDIKRLLGGLLGGGAAAGLAGGLLRNNSGSNQQAAPRPDLPVQRFSPASSQRFNYQGNPDTYGETGIGNFQFYRPNAGLLG